MADNYLITGYWGEPHVTAENDRGINAAMFGAGRFVLPVGQQFKAEYIGNNTVRVYDGKLMDNGAAAGIPAGEYVDLLISNASQGKKRNDLIVFQYSQDSSTLVESGVFTVVHGVETSGTASDPNLTQADLLSGNATFDQMALWRVSVSGATIAAPVKLFSVYSKGAMDSEVSFSGKTPIIYLDEGTSEDRLRIYSGAGASYRGGASLMLHQKDHGDYPGWFSINAADGTAEPVSLSGKPNGELTWGGKKLYGEHHKPTASDVGARPATWTPTASQVGAVPTSRKVNGKALSADITLSATDVGAVPTGYGYGEAAINLGTVNNEADLTSAIEAVYSGMASSETKMVRFNGYPSTSDYNFYGILSKSSANYGSLYANSSYGKGCFLLKTKVAGAWQPVEWINPVMTAGVEYRTAERHLGKPVYVKLVNFGALPNSTKKSVAHGISNLGYVEVLTASTSYASNGSFIPMSAGSAELNYYIGIGATDVWIVTTDDRTSFTGCYVFLKYTKTTD